MPKKEQDSSEMDSILPITVQLLDKDLALQQNGIGEVCVHLTKVNGKYISFHPKSQKGRCESVICYLIPFT